MLWGVSFLLTILTLSFFFFFLTLRRVGCTTKRNFRPNANTWPVVPRTHPHLTEFAPFCDSVTAILNSGSVDRVVQTNMYSFFLPAFNCANFWQIYWHSRCHARPLLQLLTASPLYFKIAIINILNSILSNSFENSSIWRC